MVVQVSVQGFAAAQGRLRVSPEPGRIPSLSSLAPVKGTRVVPVIDPKTPVRVSASGLSTVWFRLALWSIWPSGVACDKDVWPGWTSEKGLNVWEGSSAVVWNKVWGHMYNIALIMLGR